MKGVSSEVRVGALYISEVLSCAFPEDTYPLLFFLESPTPELGLMMFAKAVEGQ